MKNIRVSYLVVLLTGIMFLAFVPAKGKKKRSPKLPAPAHVIKKVVVPDSTENVFTIIVDKSDYELKVYDEEGWLATYPVVFGSRDLRDKMREGDKLTPDG